MEVAFQRGGHHFILHDIFPVEFDPANTVLQILLPNQLILAQIEDLDIAVIVPRHYVALVVVEGVAETTLKVYATAQQSTTTSSLPTTGSRLKTGDF